MDAADEAEWIGAARAAVAGDFAALHALCMPRLVHKARSIARDICRRGSLDDLVQAGIAKVWSRVGRVDFGRPATIRAYLMLVGERGMRDELRRILAHGESHSDGVDGACEEQPERMGLSGPVTRLCLQRYEESGNFARSFREVGASLGVAAFDVRSIVRDEIREQAPSLGIDLPEYLEDADVLAIMRGEATVVSMPATKDAANETSPKLVRLMIDELKADPNNARQHSDRNIDAIKASLTRFGQQKPIVVGANGTVIAGNGTLVAAKALGWSHIVAIRTELAGAEAKAYSIADNRTTDLSTFDESALSMPLDGIRIDDASLLDAIGFDVNQLAGYMAQASRGGASDPDDVPAPPDEAKTKPGDLWVLGSHRLLCGDSGSAKDLDRLLGGQRIHLVNTDPPYNVKVEPRSNNAIAAGVSSFSRREDKQCDRSTSERGKRDRESKRTHHQSFDVARQGEKKQTGKMRAKDRPLANDFMTDEAFDKCLDAWFGNMARALLPGHGFYIWGGYANCANYPPFLKKHKLYFSQAIIWVKGHPVLTRKDFMGNHEWCFYGWLEGAAHRYFGPNNATDVWDVKKVNPQSMVHLTEKPVELATLAMDYSSKPGENVLDLFGGSGSTLIGAEQKDRHAFLMELDPPYCDVIVERWEKFTGKKAALAK